MIWEIIESEMVAIAQVITPMLGVYMIFDYLGTLLFGRK